MASAPPSSEILYLGDHLAAMGAKLITNLAWYINAAAMAELFALSVRAGIRPDQVQAVLRKSCGNSWVAERDIPSILDGTYDRTFRLRLAVKDLQLIAELADMLGVPCDLAPVAGAVFRRAMAAYGPDGAELTPVQFMLERLLGIQFGPASPDLLAASWLPAQPANGRVPGTPV